jgi:hypothetical protein
MTSAANIKRLNAVMPQEREETAGERALRMEAEARQASTFLVGEMLKVIGDVVAIAQGVALMTNLPAGVRQEAEGLVRTALAAGGRVQAVMERGQN